MELNKTCFKIDKPNAKAMIDGFWKDGKLYRQSIWLAVKNWLTVKDRVSPPLLTFNRTPTRFYLSRIGEEMDAENCVIPFKYIAELDREYFVKNEIPLWKTVCSNGLFDIWDSEAPYKRFALSKSDPAKFRIQLLRIYEIDHEFNYDDIRNVSPRIDKLKSLNQKVKKIDPVISCQEFRNLKELLEHSVAPYLNK
ncbi:MAG: hypothetical protein BWY69_01257 [Planctomycetes bacterium ADurb.Bin401]|nr:MAG: hypothetical protein BWY69_01257 [Planctomycetes bacterium ADurb.Bin401]